MPCELKAPVDEVTLAGVAVGGTAVGARVAVGAAAVGGTEVGPEVGAGALEPLELVPGMMSRWPA